MSQKVQRIRYQLDTKDVKQLPDEEIAAILRAADAIVMRGGRTLLTKILKGSRAKEVLGLKLNKTPRYGYYNHLTMSQIQARVDWVIQQGYLAIEYELSVPLLRYTQRGWEIERATVAHELLASVDALLESEQTTYDMTYLKNRPRDMIMLLLDLVEKTGDLKYIPVLEAWAAIDYQDVRQRIVAVKASLQKR